MTNARKKNGDVSDVLEPQIDLSQELLEKRRGEREGFLRSLEEPYIVENCANAEIFTPILSLAFNDYGVRRRTVAEALRVDESTVGRWAKGEYLPQEYSRPHIVDVVAKVLKADLIKERS